MKNYSSIYTICLTFLIFSCDIEGVKELEEKDVTIENEIDSLSKNQNTSIVDSLKRENDDELLGKKLAKPDTVIYDNGVQIVWKRKGEGEEIKSGDLVDIDYRVSLEDGGVYDGNHLIKKESIPFLVGWNMQTKGWDFAFQKLREGDDVEIFLPAALARGEKGIPGLVPPNSNNIIALRVFKIRQPTIEVEEIKIWRVEQAKNPGDSIKFGDEVHFHFMVSAESNPRYDYSYKRGEEFVYVMGEDNVIPGLYKALHYARRGDKLMVYIPAEQAFGKKGLKGLVKPDEDIFYDILVTKVNSSSDTKK